MKVNVKNIKLPKEVSFIINEIYAAGGEAYAVGGAIRDSLLGKVPKDWDIASSLSPSKVKDIFKAYKIIDKGIEFGTVSVYINEEEFEITTFRTESKSCDGRHPSEIKYANSIVEDLSRRDFTINAMAYNQEGLIDPFGGLADLNSKIIRAVGSPTERFEDDALRMLRAIRQSAQHDLKIEPSTYKGICENSHLIANVSMERFNQELTKILTSKKPELIEEIYRTGMAKIILPELVEIFKCLQDNPNHYRGNRVTSVGEHTMDTLKASVVEGLSNPKCNALDFRLALLMHDFGKPSTKTKINKNGFGEIDSFFNHPKVSVEIAEGCLKRLKFPKSIIREVLPLIKHHDIEFYSKDGEEIRPSASNIRRAYSDFGGSNLKTKEVADKLMQKLIAIKVCDSLGQNPERFSNFPMESAKEKVENLETISRVLESNRGILNVAMNVNGETVKNALGMDKKEMKLQGKLIGSVISKLQEKVIKDNSIIEALHGTHGDKIILSLAQSMGYKKVD